MPKHENWLSDDAIQVTGYFFDTDIYRNSITVWVVFEQRAVRNFRQTLKILKMAKMSFGIYKSSFPNYQILLEHGDVALEALRNTPLILTFPNLIDHIEMWRQGTHDMSRGVRLD